VRVTVASGANRELPLVLTPELAVIEFTTTPPDAELLLDGTPRGSATQRLELPTREHQVIVRRAGYASYRTLITPRKGIDKHLKIRLKTAAEMAREPAAQTNAASSATAQAAAAPTAAAPRTLPSGVPPAAAPTQRSAEAERQADLVSSILTPPELAGAAPVEFAADGRVRSILGQELMLVRGGEFRPAGGRDSVRLARPFYLALREVSNGEYRRFVTSHITRGPAGQDLDAATLPVANLTWEAAATYCNWLSRRESLPPFYQISFGRVLGINPEAVGYRLPTEAEWEFAARITPARDELEFPWSGRYPPRGRVGNFADENARALVAEVISGFDDGFAAAAPVGSYPPNLRGFHDLAGNVSEWVHDFHAPHSATGADPLGPLSGKSHVVRGSSWAQAAPAALRLDARTAGMGARPDLGFRLARYAR
jgi:formylglycine-generating enzyme required for sulfatase activity